MFMYFFILVVVSVFIEIPGCIFCILVMDCWGRRPILTFCQIFSGVACIACGLLQGVEDPSLQLLQVDSYCLIVYKMIFYYRYSCPLWENLMPLPLSSLSISTPLSCSQQVFVTRLWVPALLLPGLVVSLLFSLIFSSPTGYLPQYS